MKVVSNAGPLIALGKLGQLGMLDKLYGVVHLPREVHTEVVVNGLRLGAPEAQTIDWLVTGPPASCASSIADASPALGRAD